MRAPLLLAGLMLLAACATDPTSTAGDRRQRDDASVVATPEGAAALRHEVYLSPAQPERGDTLRIRSVVRNTGSEPVVVSARICGVDLRGGPALDVPWARCGGYSMDRHTMAPGDSIVEHDGGIVTSGIGEYELQVRHLLTPELWVKVPVMVRP
jgi:hypothetical protein